MICESIAYHKTMLPYPMIARGSTWDRAVETWYEAPSSHAPTRGAKTHTQPVHKLLI